MALLQQWRDMAYSEKADKAQLQKLWTDYFQKEKDIYAILLKNPDEVVKGTVKELAEKYSVDIMTMTGFLDGINDSLKEQNPIDDMEEDTEVQLGFDKELLYKNMVAAGADWLYGSRRNFTRSRRLHRQFARRTRFILTIPVRVEVVRSTRSATVKESSDSLLREKTALYNMCGAFFNK